MRHLRTLFVVAAVVLVALVSGCGGSGDDSSVAPAVVTPVEGTDLNRITLTEKAAERLDIQTAAVVKNGTTTEIPYSAVLYSPSGETWTYVSVEPLVFVRHRIVVDRIEGDRALLSDGPTPGKEVATVGVAELYGAESGIGQ